MGVPENARAKGARQHKLDQTGLARVNPTENTAVVFEKEFLRPALSSKHSVTKRDTRPFLEDFGSF